MIGECTPAQLPSRVVELKPDALVLDAITAPSPGHLLRDVGGSRPLAALWIVDSVQEERTHSAGESHRVVKVETARLTRLDRLDQSVLRTKLHLLAALGHESKQTLTSESLQDVIDDLWADPSHEQLRAVVPQLATTPVEAVLLVGGPQSWDVLASVLASTRAPKVPVLALLADPSPTQERQRAVVMARPEVEFAEMSVQLRRISGVLVAPTTRRLLIRDGMAILLPGAANPRLTVDSCATELEQHAVIAALGPIEAPLATSLDNASTSAHTLFVPHPRLGPGVNGLENVPRLTPRELGSLLDKLIPRRL